MKQTLLFTKKNTGIKNFTFLKIYQRADTEPIGSAITT